MSTPFHLLQLTDTHIFEDPSGRLCGLSTLDSLRDVIAAILSRKEPFDAVLLTGDLCHDQKAPAYRRLADLLAPLGKPCFALPGNHDDPEEMIRGFEGTGVSAPGEADFGPWKGILLNSRVAGENGGALALEELERLKTALEAEPDRPAFVALHHSPVPVHSTWMDTMMVKNNEALLSIVDKFRRVRLILWGHVHQQYESGRNGVRLLATPSTSVQFKPQGHNFGLEKTSPGYRILTLYPDGRLETRVMRAPTSLEFLDESIKGY